MKQTIFYAGIAAAWLGIFAADSKSVAAMRAEEQVVTDSGAAPTIAVDSESGVLYAAWIGKQDGRNQAFVARSEDGKSFASPLVVSAQDQQIASSAVSPAQVTIGTRNQVYVVYEQRIPSAVFDRGRGVVRLAHSTDGGRSFAPAIDVSDGDGVETSAESPALLIEANGTVLIAWLDHREELARAALPENQRPEDKRWLDSDDPVVSVRLAKSFDGAQSFAPSVVLAEGASEHSRVALKSGPGGTLYAAWRAKLNQFKGSYDAVRDVVVAISRDRGHSWSTPLKVHDDRFKAGDCPEITLGMDTDSRGRLHLAWYTGTSLRPGVYYARSDDGKNFTEPVRLLVGDWVPYADAKLAVDQSDRAWVAFEDRRQEQLERVILTRINARGQIIESQSWSGRDPDLIASRQGIRLLRVDEKGAVRMLSIAE